MTQCQEHRLCFRPAWVQNPALSAPGQVPIRPPILSFFTCKMGLKVHILQCSLRHQNDTCEVPSLPLSHWRGWDGGVTIRTLGVAAEAEGTGLSGRGVGSGQKPLWR